LGSIARGPAGTDVDVLENGRQPAVQLGKVLHLPLADVHRIDLAVLREDGNGERVAREMMIPVPGRWPAGARAAGDSDGPGRGSRRLI